MNVTNAQTTESSSFGGVAQAKRVQIPFSPEELRSLHAGDLLLMTGTMYTLRDAGHIRLLEELDAAGERATGATALGADNLPKLPYGLKGQIIFYAGPTPSAAGRPFGAIGPTTASRMDFAAPRLYDAGVQASLGKGLRSPEVREACVRNEALYLVAVGGAAAYLARCIRSEEVVAYPDLGTEALRRIEVEEFPAFVGIDTRGADIYQDPHLA